MNRPLQVGITGGIGAGKSIVCRIFKSLGAVVYDADSRAKILMATDGLLIAQIKKEFGPLAHNPDGSLNREHISKAVFEHPDQLAVLNKLVHPRVANDYLHWVADHQGHRYLLREAALLYEAGAYQSVDKMIVVSAPEELRIKRVKARDPHRTTQQIKDIMNSQWPEEEKLKRADFVILNDEQHLVIPQVLNLHQQFVN